MKFRIVRAHELGNLSDLFMYVCLDVSDQEKCHKNFEAYNKVILRVSNTSNHIIN